MFFFNLANSIISSKLWGLTSLVSSSTFSCWICFTDVVEILFEGLVISELGVFFSVNDKLSSSIFFIISSGVGRSEIYDILIIAISSADKGFEKFLISDEAFRIICQ